MIKLQIDGSDVLLNLYARMYRLYFKVTVKTWFTKGYFPVQDHLLSKS